MDHLHLVACYRMSRTRLLGYGIVPGFRLIAFLTALKFQKIFVIGLASRTDRRDSMSLAAAYTGLDIEYIDGVTTVSDKALPPHDVETKVRNESIWAWRAHMNALRK